MNGGPAASDIAGALRAVAPALERAEAWAPAIVEAAPPAPAPA